MTQAFVALGANLGDAVTTVTAAIGALAIIEKTRLVAQSSLYRTAPVGLKNQPDFINAVVQIDTQLAPIALLQALFAIEARFGRSRSVPNAPRTLDLDLLLYGEVLLATRQLTLPHPRMHERAFVLAPLAEIAPDCHIAGHGSVSELLRLCSAQRFARLASTS